MFDFDEQELITRTQHGDTEAFNPLVSKYHPRVYTHILGRVKNEETAKDLAQDTWVRAFRAIKTFRGESAFYSWLYRIAENVCLDHFRKQKNAHDMEPLHAIPERRITETNSCPSRDMARQELREHLHDAIQCLTPTRRMVFFLYYIQELSVKAIATRLSKSEGTIKSHLRNARLQLRELLLPYVRNEPM